MARKIPFTDEQIHILEQNMYTHSVSPQRISFTLEFKQFFLDQCRNHRKSTIEIFKAAGYDISFFSRDNLDAIKAHILKEADSETGLRVPKGLSTEQKTAAFEAKDLSKQKTDATIKELQERVVHLEKQVEFLKKISHIRNS